MKTSTKNRIGFSIFGWGLAFIESLITCAALDLVLAATHSTIVGIEHKSDVEFTQYNHTTNFDADIRNNSSYNSSLAVVHKPFCAKLATSAILIAYYVPTGLTSLIYSLFLVSVDTNKKTIFSCITCCVGIILIGLVIDETVLLVGICILSISVRLYHTIQMTLVENYGNEICIRSFGSGYGIGSFCGTFGYLILIKIASVQVLVFLTLLIPFAFTAIQYKLIQPLSEDETNKFIEEDKRAILHKPETAQATTHQSINGFSFKQLKELLPESAPYFLPMFFFSIIAYIAVDAFELIYFPGMTYMNRAVQFRLSTVALGCGFILGTLSYEVIKFKKLWLMTLIEYILSLIFLFHVAKIIYLPSFYIILANIFLQGILSGLIFVSSFSQVSSDFDGIRKKYTLSLSITSYTFGLVIGTISGMFVRNALCELY